MSGNTETCDLGLWELGKDFLWSANTSGYSHFPQEMLASFHYPDHWFNTIELICLILVTLINTKYYLILTVRNQPVMQETQIQSWSDSLEKGMATGSSISGHGNSHGQRARVTFQSPARSTKSWTQLKHQTKKNLSPLITNKTEHFFIFYWQFIFLLFVNCWLMHSFLFPIRTNTLFSFNYYKCTSLCWACSPLLDNISGLCFPNIVCVSINFNEIKFNSLFLSDFPVRKYHFTYD